MKAVRRRSKAQMKADKEAAAQKEADIQKKLAQVDSLKRELNVLKAESDKEDGLKDNIKQLVM